MRPLDDGVDAAAVKSAGAAAAPPAVEAEAVAEAEAEEGLAGVAGAPLEGLGIRGWRGGDA